MPNSAAILVTVALATAAPSGPERLRGEVDLAGAHGLAIRPPPPGPPAGPHAAARTVVLELVPGGVRVHARWQLASAEPGWYADTLIGPGAHVERVAIAGVVAGTGTAAGSDTGTHVIARVHGSSSIELVAFVPGDPVRTAMDLVLAPAVRGTIELRDRAVRLEISEGRAAPRSGAIHHAGQSALRLVPAPPKPDPDAAPFVVGHVGLGVTVGDAEVRSHARLRWEPRRGRLARVAVRATGIADDLTVTGPRVREHRREGDRIVVDLEGEQTEPVEVELKWSTATPRGEATLELPRLELEGVARSEMTVAIARDGDVDVVPQLRGWTATAPQALPGFGRDLIEGSPTAAFRSHGAVEPGALALLRFVPVAGPPAVVARAHVRAVTTREGRMLVQMRYEIANERKQNLRVALPPGARLLSVEAAGRDVAPAKDGAAWLVPLPRSLETVEGLLEVPVVVVMLLERERWARRDRRRIDLPTIDVPIRRIDAEVELPRGFAARMKTGEYGVRAIDRVVGPRGKKGATQLQLAARHRGTTAPNAAAPAGDPIDDTAAKDRLIRNATEAYQRNDFGEAQRQLDELERQGAQDERARKLQSNLAVVAGDGDVEHATPVSGKTAVVTKEKLGLVRRVREQAKARAGSKIAEQRDRKERAKRLRAQGKYDEAKAEYRRALKVNDELKKLEQEESATADLESEEIEADLEETETEAAAAESMQKLVDPAWLSIGEPAEHGWAALDPADVPVAEPSPPPVAPPLDDGPRVLVPRGAGGDVVHYGFDLWAEGARHALVVRARRRLELPPAPPRVRGAH